MSADNLVCIAKFNDGFRVRETTDSCLEGINQFDDTLEEQIKRKEYIRQLFSTAKFFTTETEAIKYSIQLHQEIGWTEYGICSMPYDGTYGDI
jgi:hypothetical protein